VACLIKKVGVLLVLLLLIAVSGIAWQIIRNDRLDRSFRTIKIGDTKTMVVKQMGRSWKDEECGKEFGGQPEGCAEEYIYAPPFAPYDPTYWVVSFDTSGHVINTVELQSP
jgi:hypothetical protein